MTPLDMRTLRALEANAAHDGWASSAWGAFRDALEANAPALLYAAEERESLNDAMAEAWDALDGYGRENPSLALGIAQLQRHHNEARAERDALRAEVERLTRVADAGKRRQNDRDGLQRAASSYRHARQRQGLPMTTPNIDTNALRELEAKATKGPWIASGFGGVQMDGYRDKYEVISEPQDSELFKVCWMRSWDGESRVTAHNNASLVAALRNAAPALLDAAEERDKYQAAWLAACAALRSEKGEVQE